MTADRPKAAAIIDENDDINIRLKKDDSPDSKNNQSSVFGIQKHHSSSSPFDKQKKAKNANKVVSIQLFVSAKNLTDMDLMSKSDPFCTL